jgi:protein-L-isoaspartate(D-aspartate) O-methyltransferase
MDWNDENLTITAEQGWWHATITFPGDTLSTKAATALSAALSGRRFHFLRKEGKLRLRTEQPAAEILNQLVTDQLASGWAGGIYEPEVDAFGGSEGMDIAHDVFCADSPAALAESGSPYARERAILLISTLNRSAGLDPFETGDVWARIAALRPPIKPPDPPLRATALAAMRHLMNADAAQRETTEPGWPDRVAAYETAGRELARLATAGRLTRGLRAVLAHHAIFVFNRAGTSPAEQAAAAWLGRHAVFDDDEPTAVSTAQPAPARPNLTEMETTITTTADPAELRDAMVSRLTNSGHLRTPAVIEAFRDVERHEFIPDADPQAAYVDDAIAIKHDDHGEMISCISAPSIVATQLEQLGARPGHNILEAGAATGYNAALLGRLVTPGGHVWTVDVDPDLVDNAATHLAAARSSNVTVLLADGAAGLPEHGPYDRIQFTVGAGDVPPGILEQLAPGGRLVIPMRIRGSISRSFAFERDGDTWKTVSCEMATFVPLRKGVCDDVYTLVPHDGEGNVRLETFSEQEVDREAMRTILDTPSTKVYTGVKFRQGSPWQWVYLWLACVLPNGLSRMPGQRPGFTPHFGWGSMAALDSDSLAYLTVREGDDDAGRFWEIGVIGHGTDAATLSDQVATAIIDWDRDYGNDAPEPGFRMATAAHRDLLKAHDPRFIIDKRLSRLVVDWP